MKFFNYQVCSLKFCSICLIRPIPLASLSWYVSGNFAHFSHIPYAVYSMSQLACSFSSHCHTQCNISNRSYPVRNEILLVISCFRDVTAHLRQISVAHTCVLSNKKLTTCVGFFAKDSRDFSVENFRNGDGSGNLTIKIPTCFKCLI